MTMRRSIAVVLMLLGSLALGLAGIAQQSATEAPAGFDTPTLSQNPGSRSISNGIEEPPGDTFALDQQIYEQTHDVNSGLGPVFNARACAECHQNPVSGGASQFTELRAGHLDAAGTFANPTVLINDGADRIAGRSIINEMGVTRSFIRSATSCCMTSRRVTASCRLHRRIPPTSCARPHCGVRVRDRGICTISDR